MPESRSTKKIFKWNPLTTRPRGRPKHGWEDNIIQELGQMKIKIWITCVQDRANWKDIVENAKTSIKGGPAPEEEEELKNKNQLDAIYYFIVLLISSTCFGHY